MMFHKPTKRKKIEHDGLIFDSKDEVKRYDLLKAWEQAGKITGLSCHPTFELQPKFSNVRPITYTPDFMYTRDGQVIIEDVKPWYKDKKTGKWKTICQEDFTLKWKMFQFQHQDFKCILTGGRNEIPNYPTE